MNYVTEVGTVAGSRWEFGTACLLVSLVNVVEIVLTAKKRADRLPPEGGGTVIVHRRSP